VADVDRGREAGAGQRRRDRADAVDGEARHGRVGVAGGFRRLDVLQRAEHVEQAHRQDHRHQVLGEERVREARDQVRRERHRKVEADRGDGPRDARRVDRGGIAERPQEPRRRGAEAERPRAPGDAQRQVRAREVRDEDHAQRQDRDQRRAEGLHREVDRDEADGDAGERRQQRRARRVAADLLRHERARKLDQRRHEAGRDADLPRDARRIRLAEAFAQGSQLDRQHDEHHEREQRHRVDAVRQRGHVAPAGARREPLRLPGVEGVADHDRQRRRRQDRVQQQVDREAEHAGAEAEDQQELDQVVDREAEEAVDVAGLEERLRRAARPARRPAIGSLPRHRLVPPTSIVAPREGR
jgi:hypothetical protein